jgi:hypothetical protein
MAKIKDKLRESGKALISLEQELRDQAQLARATEESVQTGQFFGTKGGILTFNGAPIKDNKMEVVVLDHVLANLFYVGKFNAKESKPPVCYAFGRDDKTLAPHEKASDKQSAACKDCEQNVYGTADTGRGKACKNSRRLACMSAALLETPEAIPDAQVAYLGTPVTSGKGWAGYVRQVVDTFGVPPLGVITEVSLVADAKDQFKMVFRCVERISDKKVLMMLLQKNKLVAKEIAFPFPDLEDMPARKPEGKQRAAATAKQAGKGGKAKAGAKQAPGGFGAAKKF